MKRLLNYVPMLLVAAAALGAVYILPSCESVPAEAGLQLKKTKYGVTFEVGVGEGEAEVKQPINFPAGVSWTDKDGNQVGSITNIVIPTSVPIPEGAVTMHVGKPGAPPPPPSGSESDHGPGGGMFQQDVRSQATESLVMSSGRLASTVNWQFGFPITAEGHLYYVEIDPYLTAHNFESVYALIRPVLEGGGSVVAPDGVTFEMLARLSTEDDSSTTVEFLEQEPFETFLLALNTNHMYATLGLNSTLADYGNGWHGVSVNIPQDDFNQSFPRAFNSSSVMWTTESDEPGQYEAFHGWAITTSN